MRKVLAALVCAAMISALCACGNKAENSSGVSAPQVDDGRTNPVRESDFEFKEVSGGIKIIRYNGSAPIVTIPEAIDGKKVVSIYGMGFSNHDGIVSLHIPASVIEIGRPFIYSERFEQITVADENPAYYTKDGVLYSKEDNKLVTYPRGKTNESFEIPDGVMVIGEYAFNDAKNLKSVSIPESVTELEEGAFNNCANLDKANIPEKITSFNAYVFAGCGTLEGVEITGNIEKISGYAFFDSKWAENHEDENGLVIVNGILINSLNAKGDVTVPESVREVADGAFYCNDEVTSVTVPNPETVVSENAFAYCNNLKTVTHGGVTYDPNKNE